MFERHSAMLAVSVAPHVAARYERETRRNGEPLENWKRRVEVAKSATAGT